MDGNIIGDKERSGTVGKQDFYDVKPQLFKEGTMLEVFVVVVGVSRSVVFSCIVSGDVLLYVFKRRYSFPPQPSPYCFFYVLQSAIKPHLSSWFWICHHRFPSFLLGSGSATSLLGNQQLGPDGIFFIFLIGLEESFLFS